MAAGLARGLSQFTELLPTRSSSRNPGWQVVRSPDRTRSEYEAALDQIQAAADRRADDEELQLAKAMGELRLERPADSLATLQALSETAGRQTNPEELGVRCLCLVELGRIEEAEEQLGELDRILLTQPASENAQALSFLLEAQALLDDMSLR